MPLDRAGNLLGALALAVADRTGDAVGGAAGHATAAMALSALREFLEEPSVDMLRRVLGLTPSGAVRLVDRLEAAGYVTRGAGRDRREVSIHLTAAGRAVAEDVSAARAAVLQDALAGLGADERGALEDLVARVLAGMIRGPGAERWMCRLCDLRACGRAEGRCPVANAARARFAS